MIGRNKPLGSDREEILHGNHVIVMLGNSGNNTTPSGLRKIRLESKYSKLHLNGC